MTFYNLTHFIQKKFGDVLSKKYVDILSDEASMKVYRQAFTSATVNPASNYEFYEQMGDVSANKFLVYYFYRRFPILKCAMGVKVVARLKINYVSKDTFSRIADEEGFWPHIQASDEWKGKRRKDLLEDVFEAFIGATEHLIDTRVKHGLGAVVVGEYLTRVFDKEEVSLKYTDLYDSKTRLKELFDKCGGELGRIKYTETKHFDSQGNSITTSRVINYPWRGAPETIGVGVGKVKADAQRAAAEDAIGKMKQRGFCKEEPAEYAIFRQG
jgi:dsRNA-specific ribonuclease